MLFEGLAIFILLLGLARLARRFGFGPEWLRRFRIEKYTIY